MHNLRATTLIVYRMACVICVQGKLLCALLSLSAWALFYLEKEERRAFGSRLFLPAADRVRISVSVGGAVYCYYDNNNNNNKQCKARQWSTSARSLAVCGAISNLPSVVCCLKPYGREEEEEEETLSLFSLLVTVGGGARRTKIKLRNVVYMVSSIRPSARATDSPQSPSHT